MSSGKIILGPIIGAVSHEKAKVWFYGTFAEDGSLKPFCHVFNKDKTNQIPGSPFEFKEISNSPYKKDGVVGKAYAAEIAFPTNGDEFCFGIDYDRAAIDDTDLKYTVKRFPAEGDSDFSFGLISCHKPRKEKIEKMWNFLYDKMSEKKSGFLIQAGDQVYCDNGSENDKNNAWKKSNELLKKDSPGTDDDQHKQMLDLYRDVYFNNWEFPEVQKVMSTFPQYMIWDDHEITDGWGSVKDHFNETSQKIYKAAKEAYIEFQHSHNPEPLKKGTFYYAFNYGSAAFLVMDLRGERNIKEERLISDDQREEIKKWLDSDKIKNSKILFVVTSVPVIHLSRSFGSLGSIIDDIADQWSYKHNKIERQKLLQNLIQWSGPENKPVFMLGGDVHVGTEVCIKKDNTNIRLHQVTSSPITNKPAWLLDFFLAPFSSSFHFSLDEEKKEFISAKIVRKHRRRNFALIEVKYNNGKPDVTINMYREGRRSLRTNKLMDACKGDF